MCASGSLFSIRPGTLGATIQGVFMRNFILTFISHLQRVCSWRGAINSILFINAVCEARPGTRAEAGTMSSLENYKWVYLAFQRCLDVTRISRYGYIEEYLLWCQATVPPHNSILPWSKPGPLYQVFFPGLLKYLGWVEKWGSQAATRCSAATKKSEFQILELQILLLCICIMY